MINYSHSAFDYYQALTFCDENSLHIIRSGNLSILSIRIYGDINYVCIARNSLMQYMLVKLQQLYSTFWCHYVLQSALCYINIQNVVANKKLYN